MLKVIEEKKPEKIIIEPTIGDYRNGTEPVPECAYN